MCHFKAINYATVCHYRFVILRPLQIKLFQNIWDDRILSCGDLMSSEPTNIYCKEYEKIYHTNEFVNKDLHRNLQTCIRFYF